MKRIALISENYPPDVGGLAISVARLARLLSEAGHQVQVFTLSRRVNPGLVEQTEDGSVLVRRMGAHRRDDDTLANWFDQIVAFSMTDASGKGAQETVVGPGGITVPLIW